MLRITCLFILLLIFYGCEKELSASGNNYLSLNDFFNKNQIPSQLFTVNAINGGAFKSNNGAVLHVMANSFVDQAGQSVTGTLEIQFKEIYEAYDMILNNKVTMSDGLPLVSGGEFYIDATLQGKELRLAPGKILEIDLPPSAVNLDQMQVFNGQTDNMGNINWKPNPDPNNTVARRDSGMTLNYNIYFDTATQFWLNCDQFEIPPFASYTVMPGNCPDIDSTMVFVDFTGKNAAVTMYRGNNVFSNAHLMADQATIIALCYKNNRFYSSFITTTLADNQSSTLNFSETTEAEFKNRIKALK